MRGLIGKKIGMTQVYGADGNICSITVIEAGPCVVTQVKTEKNDGYEAIQIGFGERKAKHTTKPQAGHFSKAGTTPKRVVAEFAPVPGFEYQAGQQFTVNLFKVGDKVKISGRSKGRGFAGVIKRHKFHRQPVSHGQSEYLRHPGSIGQASDPSRVFKGMKMAGHMGTDTVTILNLEIVNVDVEKNQLYIKGAVPGANNSYLTIAK